MMVQNNLILFLHFTLTAKSSFLILYPNFFFFLISWWLKSLRSLQSDNTVRLREADSCFTEYLRQSLMPHRDLHVSDAAGTGSTVLLPGPWWLRVLTNTLPFCILPPPAPAETISLLVIAARCHSPEPSMTQKGLSEKTLLLFWSRMGREG